MRSRQPERGGCDTSTSTDLHWPPCWGRLSAPGEGTRARRWVGHPPVAGDPRRASRCVHSVPSRRPALTVPCAGRISAPKERGPDPSVVPTTHAGPGGCVHSGQLRPPGRGGFDPSRSHRHWRPLLGPDFSSWGETGPFGGRRRSAEGPGAARTQRAVTSARGRRIRPSTQHTHWPSLLRPAFSPTKGRPSRIGGRRPSGHRCAALTARSPRGRSCIGEARRRPRRGSAAKVVAAVGRAWRGRSPAPATSS